MTREETIAFFARREADWRRLDATALTADHAVSCVVVSPTGGVLETRAEIERIYQLWFSAFPDLSFTGEDLLVDGDRVALLCRVTGTHMGEFFGLPATGRRVEFTGVFMYTLSDRQIVYERRILDFTGVLVQVGVLKARPAGRV